MIAILRCPSQSIASAASAIRTPLTAVLVGAAFLLAAQSRGVGSEVPSAKALTDFAAPPIEAIFTNGLAVVKAASGFQEVAANQVFSEWRTNLCLILGFRVEEGSKRFVGIVSLTTLPPVWNDSTGKAALPPDARFGFYLGATASCPTGQVVRFTSPRLPVSVCMYDERGRFLKQSREEMSWQFLTNGLVAPCLAMAAASTNGLNALPLIPGSVIAPSVAALVGLFGDALGADALEELRDRAMVVVRSPNWLKVLFELKLDLNLAPHFERATIFPSQDGQTNNVHVLFPAELRQGKRLLTTVEFVAGFTVGPHFLTAGVRAIRAVHPTKPDHRLLVRVLAAGVVGNSPDPTL